MAARAFVFGMSWTQWATAAEYQQYINAGGPPVADTRVTRGGSGRNTGRGRSPSVRRGYTSRPATPTRTSSPTPTLAGQERPRRCHLHLRQQLQRPSAGTTPHSPLPSRRHRASGRSSLLLASHPRATSSQGHLWPGSSNRHAAGPATSRSSLCPRRHRHLCHLTTSSSRHQRPSHHHRPPMWWHKP